MNLSDHFEVISTADQVFHFRLKGFIPDGVTEQIEADFNALFRKNVDSVGAGGRAFYLLVDMSELKTLPPKAKAMVAECMMYLGGFNLIKAVEVMPSAITRASLDDAAEKSGEDDFRIVVDSVQEAWETINNLKADL